MEKSAMEIETPTIQLQISKVGQGFLVNFDREIS